MTTSLTLWDWSTKIYISKTCLQCDIKIKHVINIMRRDYIMEMEIVKKCFAKPCRCHAVMSQCKHIFHDVLVPTFNYRPLSSTQYSIFITILVQIRPVAAWHNPLGLVTNIYTWYTDTMFLMSLQELQCNPEGDEKILLGKAGG